MFKIFNLIFIFLFIFINNVDGQNSEIGISYRFGIPLNNLTPLPIPYNNNITSDTRSIKPLNDQGFQINFQGLFWKKLKLYYSFGYEYSVSKDYLHIFTPQPIDNIFIKNNRTVLLFGLHKHFHFYDNKLILDLGLDLNKRYSEFDQSSYKSDFHFSQNYNWIDYSYQINIYSELPGDFNSIGNKLKNISCNYSLHLKFLLKKNFYFKFGVEYIRNVIYYYDYTYTTRFYYGGSDTPSEINTYNAQDPYIKESINKKYLYLTSGINYKFNLKKPAFLSKE